MQDNYPTRLGNTFNFKFIGCSVPKTNPFCYSMCTNGFVVVKKLFTTETITEAITALQLLQNRPDLSVIHDVDKKTIRSIFSPHLINDVFYNMAKDTTLLHYIRSLIGNYIYIHQSRINFKTPNSTGWGWHSDFETWHAEDGMPGMQCITMMLALTDNIKGNGPLEVIPKSHQYYVSCPGKTPSNNWASSLVDQKIGVPDETTIKSILVTTKEKITQIYLQAGDAIFFHCNLLHRSAINYSSQARTNVFFCYNDIANSLVAPYSALLPRPEYAGCRAVIPY